MGGFSKRSLDNLIGVHPNLIKIMKEAIKDSPVDNSEVELYKSNYKEND